MKAKRCEMYECMYGNKYHDTHAFRLFFLSRMSLIKAFAGLVDVKKLQKAKDYKAIMSAFPLLQKKQGMRPTEVKDALEKLQAMFSEVSFSFFLSPATRRSIDTRHRRIQTSKRQNIYTTWWKIGASARGSGQRAR